MAPTVTCDMVLKAAQSMWVISSVIGLRGA